MSSSSRRGIGPPIPRLLVVLLAAIAASAGGVARAQACVAELERALAGSAEPGIVTGSDAARALAGAVRLAEPALPPLVRVDTLPVPLDHPAVEDVRYLAERRLLPPDWSADALSAAAWRGMLDGFLGWYGLAPVGAATPPPDDAALVHAVGMELERVRDAVRPAALIVPSGDSTPAFRGVLWNWSVVPRLLVFPPLQEDAGVSDAVRSLESCVRQIRHWFSATGSHALELFAQNNRARMVVIESHPSGAWPWWVPPGDEVDVLTFAHPQVAGLDAFAAVFDGPPVGLGRLLRLLTQVRTNVSPVGLQRYLQTPP